MIINKILLSTMALSLFIGCGGSTSTDEEQPSTTNTNTKPLVQDVSIKTKEDEPIMITLQAEDRDQDNIHYTLTQPAHGSLKGEAPSLTYTPDMGYNGEDSFYYHVSDGQLDSKEASVDIMIASTNVPPVVSPLNESTKEEGTEITFMGNAEDRDGDTLSYKWQEGDITLSTQQNFTKSDFSAGEHTITCIVTDTEGASDSQDVTIHILPTNGQNDAPIADAKTVKTKANTPVDITLSGSDIDGNYLEFKISYQPQYGTLTGTLPTLTYTPNKDFRGYDSFKYQAYDGEKYSDMSTVTIQVNENPTVEIQGNTSVTLGESVTLSANASDDGSIASYRWTQNGTFLSNNASFSYTPTQMGKQNISVEVTDNLGAKGQGSIMLSVKKIQPMVVIMIEFNDYQFHSSIDTWQQKIFGTQEGELNDYYDEISYGTFQFTPAKENFETTNDGIIKFKLNMNHPGDIGFGEDWNTTHLVEAINATNEYMDYAQYDVNHNGALSKDELQVMFLVAGGESATGLQPGIWAHQSCINGVTLDGVKVMECGSNGTYARFGESHFEMGEDATIGVIAHELGHSVFGLPDLYDTTNYSAGIGAFGLMGAGSWGQKTQEERPGATPVHMTGWSKLYTHFTRAMQIEQDRDNLAFRGSAYSDYLLYKIQTGRDGEYFLVENRVNEGYDRGLYLLDGGENFQSGLSILHIDQNVNDDSYFNINNDDASHKLVDVEEAKDAQLDSSGTSVGSINNLFFGTNIDKFTPTTTPNSNRYDGTSSGFSITNISNSDDTMHADITIQR